jgi:hypothetical protein
MSSVCSQEVSTFVTNCVLAGCFMGGPSRDSGVTMQNDDALALQARLFVTSGLS